MKYSGQDYEKLMLIEQILEKAKELTETGYGNVKFVEEKGENYYE